MKKLIAGFVTALFTAGLVFGVATAAQAHTGDLPVTIVCNTTTGNYDGTALLKIGNAGTTPGTTHWRQGTPTFDGTPNSTANMPNYFAVAGDGTYAVTTFTLPGTSTGFGPWVYAYTEFTNTVKVGSDGQSKVAMDGKCKPNTIKVSPTAPVVNDTCDLANDGYVLPANVPGVTYAFNGKDIVATLTAGYAWDALNGYVDNGNGTATYAFDPAKFTDVPCTIQPPDATRDVYTEDTPDCTVGYTVAWKHEYFKTPYIRVNGAWVPGTEVLVKTDTGTRDLTPAETAPCAPPVKIDYSNWVDEKWACEATTTVQTREKTVTPYIYSAGVGFIVDTINILVTKETQTRTLNANEVTTCTVIERLAATGSSPMGLLLAAYGLIVAGLTFYAVRLALKKPARHLA